MDEYQPEHWIEIPYQHEEMKFSDFHKQMQNTTKLNLFSEHQLSIDYSLFKNSSIKDTTYFCTLP